VFVVGIDRELAQVLRCIRSSVSGACKKPGSINNRLFLKLYLRYYAYKYY